MATWNKLAKVAAFSYSQNRQEIEEHMRGLEASLDAGTLDISDLEFALIKELADQRIQELEESNNDDGRRSR